MSRVLTDKFGRPYSKENPFPIKVIGAKGDGAVEKTHTHANEKNLDEISESSSGVLTYKGEEYVRKADLESYVQAEKEYLFATRTSSSQNLDIEGTSLIFNNLNNSNGGINYDTSSGVFTLTPGNVYRITVNASFLLRGTSKTINLAVNNRADGTNHRPLGVIQAGSAESNYSPTNNLECIVEATPTSNTFSIVKLTPNEAFMEANSSSLIVQEI